MNRLKMTCAISVTSSDKRALVPALLTLIILASACGTAAPESPASADIDLIPLHAVARLRTETGAISIDSAQAESWFVRGWSTQAVNAEGLEGPVVAAIARQALLRFNTLEAVALELEFSASLSGELGNLPRQSMRLQLNDEPVGTIEIIAGAVGPYRLALPADRLRVGMNRLVINCEQFHRDRDFESSTRRVRNRLGYPGFSVYLAGISIRRADEKTVTPIDEFSRLRPAADGGALIQRADCDLQYAFDIAAGSSLVLEGSLEGAAAAWIFARTDGDKEPEMLWQSDISPQARNFSQTLSLDAFAGKPTILQFSVRAAERGTQAGVVWKKLRLVLPKPVPVAVAETFPRRVGTGIRHVVLLVLDAARPDYFGCYGHPGGLTPHIDAIAGEGVRFETAIAAAPYTIASMSTVFSGLLPDTHGVRDGRDIYPEKLTNMGDVFRQRGYFTLALAGTQFLTRKYGITRNFDEVIYLRRDEDKADEVATMDMEAAERGIRLAAASGKPAFMYIHLLPPHFPYRPPAPYDTKLIDSRVVDKEYLRKIRTFRGDETNPLVQELRLHYQNNLIYADALVGQIVDQLKAAGLYDETLLIITADHGEAFAEHGALEHGNTVYDEMIRVPLIIRGPGIGAAHIGGQVGLVDFFPTLDELFGLTAAVEFDGTSFAGELFDVRRPSTETYYSRAYGDRLKFTLRGERFKYHYIDQADFLYDLSTDPGERTNLASSRPALTAMLRQRGLLLVSTNTARSGAGSMVELTRDEEEELRNLGYLQ